MKLAAILMLMFGGAIGAVMPVECPAPEQNPGKVVCPFLPEYSPKVWEELGKEMHVLDPDTAVAKFVRDYIRTRATVTQLCAST